MRTLQQKKNALFQDNGDRVGLGSEGHFDTDIYGSSSSKFEGYVTSIAPNEDQDVSSFGVFFYYFVFVVLYPIVFLIFVQEI